MEPFVFIILMIISVIYNIYDSAKKKSKKKQKRAPGGVFPEGKGPRGPVHTEQARPRRTAEKPKSLDEIFAEMMKDQQGGSAEPRPQPRPAAPTAAPKPRPVPAALKREKKVDMSGREIFSYDDQYKEQKARELAQVAATGKPVRSNIQAAPAFERTRKKKTAMTGGFKFNAKDAIIYDIIMNRKY